MEYKEKAIEEVKKIAANSTNHRIQNVYPDFLEGSLYMVAYDTTEGIFYNYVYINKSEVYLAKNEALLLSWVSKKSKNLNLLEQLGGVTGIIGLIITFAIVILLFLRPESGAPRELWAAFTAILAYYFGSKAAK